jgi:hypothetical protein
LQLKKAAFCGFFRLRNAQKQSGPPLLRAAGLIVFCGSLAENSRKTHGERLTELSL